jgi:hypothetical protein
VQYIGPETAHLEVRPERPVVQGEPPTTVLRHRLNRRGGLLLDTVLSLAFVLLAAYALESVGINFHQITHVALRFFGL